MLSFVEQFQFKCTFPKKYLVDQFEFEHVSYYPQPSRCHDSMEYETFRLVTESEAPILSFSLLISVRVWARGKFAHRECQNCQFTT
jgi:hypothetical protein